MAAPRALTGWTGVRKIMMDETITEIRFMVFPILKVKGEISSRDIGSSRNQDQSLESQRSSEPKKLALSETQQRGRAWRSPQKKHGPASPTREQQNPGKASTPGAAEERIASAPAISDGKNQSHGSLVAQTASQPRSSL
nr:protein ACCELERATED CELL DEATH 6 [Ipomoea batatas]